MSEQAGRPRVVEPKEPPECKETIIRFDKVGERATVYSEHRGVVSRLLRHVEAEAEAITLQNGAVVEDDTLLSEDDTVIAYRGTVPIGALKILKTPRDSSRPSGVVTEKGDE